MNESARVSVLGLGDDHVDGGLSAHENEISLCYDFHALRRRCRRGAYAYGHVHAGAADQENWRVRA